MPQQAQAPVGSIVKRYSLAKVAPPSSDLAIQIARAASPAPLDGGACQPT
jgi:hypothetical protein